MATLLSAVMTKFDALTASAFPGSSRPSIYLDDAPLVDSSTQVRPPYVIATLEPGEAELTFESEMTEVTNLTLTAYYSSAGDLDTALSAIRFNGQSTSLNAGFDNGTLPALTDGTLLTILLQRPPSKRVSGYRDSKPVHMGELRYEITVERS